MAGKVVPFHEEGRLFYWNIASSEVLTTDGRVVNINAFNLESARKKTKAYLATIRRNR
jgi:hypothetical protein